MNCWGILRVEEHGYPKIQCRKLALVGSRRERKKTSTKVQLDQKTRRNIRKGRVRKRILQNLEKIERNMENITENERLNSIWERVSTVLVNLQKIQTLAVKNFFNSLATDVSSYFSINSNEFLLWKQKNPNFVSKQKLSGVHEGTNERRWLSSIALQRPARYYLLLR